MLPTTLDEAEAADRADPLRDLRARFHLPDGVIYLDGNSLGALPHAAGERVRAVVAREWGEDLVRSWNGNDWIGAPQRIGAKIAAIVGAGDDEVIVADSTSANIFKLVVAALADRPGRTEILTEPGNFPTDLHIAQGIARTLPGVTVRTAPAEGMAQAIAPETGVVLLTHVHYRSGRRHDMAALTAASQAAGAHIVWDLSHSVGAVAVDLARDAGGLAIGCGYKYLNGGPGAPAFLYVARELQERLLSPLSGWMGHAQPFAFGDDYKPAPGIARFLCGTPPILSLLAMEPGVEIMRDVDRGALFAKGEALWALFHERMARTCPDLPCATPAEPEARGSHISYVHEDAFAIMQVLIERGVIGDFRAPDILRFGLTPLYISHADVWRAVETIGAVIADGAWREERYQVRNTVT